MIDAPALGFISIVFALSVGELLATRLRLSRCATSHGLRLTKVSVEHVVARFRHAFVARAEAGVEDVLDDFAALLHPIRERRTDEIGGAVMAMTGGQEVM